MARKIYYPVERVSEITEYDQCVKITHCKKQTSISINVSIL